MMNKSRVKLISVASVILLSLLLVGTFLDLSISENLYQGEGNVLDLLGGFAGKLPGFLLLAVSFAVLLSYVKSNRESYKKSIWIILYIVYIAALLVSYVLAFYSALEEITSKAKYFGLVIGAIMTAITIIIVFRGEMSHPEELKKWALLTILAIGIVIVLTVGIKEVWGRTRYIDIVKNGGEFNAWYEPQGFGGGHSFPSGHTALFGTLVLLLPLFDIFGYRGEGISALGIFIANIIVGAFRIIGGHHYLTDVVMSMIITYVTCIIVMCVGYRKKNLQLSEKNWFRHI